MQQAVAKHHPAPSRERDDRACGLYETTIPPRHDHAWPNDQPARMECNQNAVPLMGNCSYTLSMMNHASFTRQLQCCDLPY